MMKKRKNAAKIISDNKYFINYILNKKCDTIYLEEFFAKNLFILYFFFYFK